ncbi:arsenite methyltransferase [Maribellus maritimus]|uniref:arsenite methyltransferase n=1 Tax=Maribellus maritimus TaxID=2870838 RepID=UPI001EEBA185|nr:arsenite methyltransferase [Maribellus maritimus]MCG6189242.1 arsenite methyltransferase [Maribellus maritimus]
MKTNELKEVVKEKYGRIAAQSHLLKSESCCGEVDYTTFSNDYSKLPGYNADADLGLGCGIPSDKADIKEGDNVLDLGSGAGNDCFVARSLVGKTGKVTGLDFTLEMVLKAKKNAAKTGFTNIEFIHGDIEEMPFENGKFDVVISNCVLNLVPDKKKAFSEIYRVLKPGGHFNISDIVLVGNLPPKLKEEAEMYAGCVSGAIQKEEYLEMVKQQGFSNIQIKSENRSLIPDSLLKNYLSEDEIIQFKTQEFGLISMTVAALK